MIEEFEWVEEKPESNPMEKASIHMRLNEESEALKIIKQNIYMVQEWKNQYGNSIGNIAAWNGCVEVLECLYQNGFEFDINTVSVIGARHLKVIKFLNGYGIFNANAQAEHGTTPLQQACNIADAIGYKFDEDLVSESLKRIRYLIALGVDVNQRNSDGRTAVMGAAYIGAYPLVELLIEYGADCSGNIRCNRNKSTIDYAFGEYTENIIRQSLIS
ncbi:ankyrin repeat domain-containing protein (plasmid) [Alteromonas macleodii]|uniref:ankyrin repeat domain-containing protein n=1 Tax=Alteromonas macleodii TaxID=28108 RepID=UPI0030D23FEA